MRRAFLHGISFGLTSGVITTLGMMVGMFSGTQSRTVVLSSIIIIAVADGMSDAFGVHISEESDERNSSKHVWLSAFSTLLAKFLIGLLFALIIFLLPLINAIIINIVLGLILLAFFSGYIAKKNNRPLTPAILEDLLIAIFVIIVGYYLGQFLSAWE